MSRKKERVPAPEPPAKSAEPPPASGGSSPPPPSADDVKKAEKEFEENVKAVEQSAADFKALDLSQPKTATGVATMLVEQESLLYEAWAKAKDDERYRLAPEEKKSQINVMGTGLIVYGNYIKAWIFPVFIIGGLAAPAIARVFFMPPKPDPATQPKPGEKDGATPPKV